MPGVASCIHRDAVFRDGHKQSLITRVRKHHAKYHGKPMPKLAQILKGSGNGYGRQY